MLRLQHQGGAEELPSLYNKEYSKPTDPLHCLGKELLVYVRKTSSKQDLISFPAVRSSASARMKHLNSTSRKISRMVGSPTLEVANPSLTGS